MGAVEKIQYIYFLIWWIALIIQWHGVHNNNAMYVMTMKSSSAIAGNCQDRVLLSTGEYRAQWSPFMGKSTKYLAIFSVILPDIFM